MSRPTGPSRTATVLALALLMLAVVLTPAAALGAEDANGVFEVQVLTGGEWTTVATPSFGLGYAGKTLPLGGDVLQVRLVQRGGTAAQLDAVLLDGASPAAVSGLSDPSAVAKIAASDHDVVDAHGSTATLTFPAGGSVLTVEARIQGDISWAWPIEYPAANTYSRVAAGSAFYQARTAGLKPFVDTNGEPFVREWVRTGTGHPDGCTYVWLANDGDDLVVKIEFTSDNTMDGDEDYATLHVLTASGVRDFRVSVSETTWGTASFVYTDKVRYQHKVYDIRIPWSEIGGEPETLDVAFTTYGTAASIAPVHRFYNKRTGTHFYTIDHAEYLKVLNSMADLYSYDGVAYAVLLSDPGNDTPLWRFYNQSNGAHFYTIDPVEKNRLVSELSAVFSLDGVAYNVSDTTGPGARTVWRFYNKRNGAHFYTADPAERDYVATALSSLYALDGEAFYIFGF